MSFTVSVVKCLKYFFNTRKTTWKEYGTDIIFTIANEKEPGNKEIIEDIKTEV